MTLKKEYKYVSSESRPKLWQFSGLALIAIFIVYGSIAASQDEKLEREYLATPIAGDVYHYETEEGNFSTLRISEIIGDTIWIQPNDYEVNKRTGMYQLEGDENYSNFLFPFVQAELDSMYASGSVFNIVRQ